MRSNGLLALPIGSESAFVLNDFRLRLIGVGYEWPSQAKGCGMILNRTRLIVVVVAIGGMMLAACNPAVAELTASDLNGPANLSAADRTSFIDKCVARRTK